MNLRMLTQKHAAPLYFIGNHLHRGRSRQVDFEHCVPPFVKVAIFEEFVFLSDFGYPINTLQTPSKFEKTINHLSGTEFMQLYRLECFDCSRKIVVMGTFDKVSKDAGGFGRFADGFLYKIGTVPRDSQRCGQAVSIRVHAISASQARRIFGLSIRYSKASDDCANRSNCLSPPSGLLRPERIASGMQ